jgi:hypothetical protein
MGADRPALLPRRPTRLEAQTASPLLDRDPDLHFAGAPIAWGDNMILRGPRVLPLAA